MDKLDQIAEAVEELKNAQAYLIELHASLSDPLQWRIVSEIRWKPNPHWFPSNLSGDDNRWIERAAFDLPVEIIERAKVEMVRQAEKEVTDAISVLRQLGVTL